MILLWNPKFIFKPIIKQLFTFDPGVLIKQLPKNQCIVLFVGSYKHICCMICAITSDKGTDCSSYLIAGSMFDCLPGCRGIAPMTPRRTHTASYHRDALY